MAARATDKNGNQPFKVLFYIPNDKANMIAQPKQKSSALQSVIIHFLPFKLLMLKSIILSKLLISYLSDFKNRFLSKQVSNFNNKTSFVIGKAKVSKWNYSYNYLC